MGNLTLRRADLLKLVDMSARRFDAMVLRDQAPWSRRDPNRGWGEFTTEDAYLVALAHALIRQGRSYVEAGATIRADIDKLFSLRDAGPGDLLLGSFITETEASDEEPGTRLHLSLAAPKSQWFEELSRIKTLVADDDDLIAFAAVNATAVMRRTLKKAREADLVDARLLKLATKVRAI